MGGIVLSGGTTAYGDAIGNVVNINGGIIYGIEGGVANAEGSSKNNVININGGAVVNSSIIAGVGATVTDNEINIYNSPDISSATLEGYFWTDSSHSGNALNIHTKNLSAQNIANFDNVNFYLPASTVNGDTILTLTGGSATDLTGTEIKAGVEGNTNLNNGDSVTLIKNTSGITTDGTTQYGTLTEGVSLAYDITVEKADDTSIVARIGNVTPNPEPGPEPTPDPSGANYNVVTVSESGYTVNGDTTAYSGAINSAVGGLITSDADTAESDVVGGTDTSGNVTGNTVNVTGGALGDVYAGRNAVIAADNTVNMSGGTAKNVIGGEGTSGASGNKVTFSGGTVSGGTAMSADILYPDIVDFDSIISDSGNIIGGLSIDGYVTGNIVDITGGTVEGNIYGGLTLNGNATDNTVNISGAPNLASSYIYGGYSANGTSSGNTLNVYAKDITAQNIGNFQNLNFYLPNNVASGDTMLTLTDADGTDISGATVSAGVVAGNANLASGDVITLLRNENGVTANGTTYGTLTEGVSLNYDIIVSPLDTNSIGARIDNVRNSGGELLPGTESIAQGTLIAPALINIGTDRLLSWLPPDEFGAASSGDGEEEANKDVDLDKQLEKPGFEIFANMGASSMRIKTGNGSYIDSKSNGIDLGAARSFANRSGRLFVAPLVDYGHDNFDSYLASGVHGKGSSKYWAGGVIARQINNNGFYYEGSFRAGRTESDFFSNDLAVPVSYNVSAPCWAGHINLGLRYKVNDESTLDLYGIYYHSHQGGVTADLSSGETYRFDSVTNKRLRLGMRISRQVNERSRFYTGIAYQYEADGAARASYKGYTTPAAGNNGSSAMLELGWQLKPTKDSPWMLDLNATGWAGHQRGVTAQIKLKRSF